jgi:hypothetical protein
VLSMPPAFILSQDQTLHDSCFGLKNQSKVELSQPIESKKSEFRNPLFNVPLQ